MRLVWAALAALALWICGLSPGLAQENGSPCPIQTAQSAANIVFSTTYTITNNDECQILVFGAGSAITVTAPNANTVAPGFEVIIFSLAATTTVNSAVSTINSTAHSVAIGAGQSGRLHGDGVNYWFETPGAGTGGVTSVTWTGDGTIFSTTPSAAVTTIGTLLPTLLTQTADKVLAGPCGGGPALPIFRVLCAADIPPTVPTSVTNNDGTLTISPNVGAVIASIALGHPNTWTGIQTFSVGAGIAASDITYTIPNNGTFGTTIHQLAIVTAGAYTARTALTSSTTNTIGICDSNCGTTGSATLAWNGTAQCTFDGATTAGDWVVASTTAGGNCHDSGVAASSLPPGGVALIGIVTTTNGGGGLYNVDMNIYGILGASGAISYTAGTGLTLTGHTFSLTNPVALNLGGTHADLSATGGASQVLQQSSPGANVTVGRLSCASLSDSGAGCSGVAGGVTSVANLDGTLTISPTTGSVIASINLNHANTWLGAQTFNETHGTLVLETTTSHTLAQSDCGKEVKMTNAGANTFTVPDTITGGLCPVGIRQGPAAGQITVVVSGAATLVNAHSFTKTFGINALIGVINDGAALSDWTLTGDGV